ncbi:MAG: sulfatase-like hydrolase/transferase [Balneolaceae bacterium]
MKPNFLVIMSDQHNPHFTGYGGDTVVRTPVMDRLSKKGVNFENTYCAAPVCVPSRMTFLSSQYPSDLELWTNDALLNPYLPTFAHQISRADYETVLCGRMHFEGPLQHHGFKSRVVGDVNGARDTSRPLFEDRFPVHVTEQDYRSVQTSGSGNTSYIAYDDEVTKRAQEFLRQWKKTPTSDAFFLMVGFLLPHNPYICTQSLFEEYMDKVTLPEISQEILNNEHHAVQKLRAARGLPHLTPEDFRRTLAAYYGLITTLDEFIGAILQTLEETSMHKDTIVVYLSDHGDLAGEHNLWWKDSFYDGSVKVPMVFSFPEKFQQNQVVSTPVSLLDVGPTLIDIANAEPIPAARGTSLLPKLTGKGEFDDKRPVFSELYPQHPKFLDPGFMVRKEEWKLNVYHGYEHPQLFNMKNDPDELKDLGKSEEHVEIRKSLLKLVHERWSGEKVIEKTKIRQQQTKSILDWHKRFEEKESETWKPPSDSNWLES